ncbi:MAG: desulfoferrodoxin family protein [Peptococcaceae bacterium]|nr:desulfoferrodoxin family protein [Peptococcaceae bacterium]
MAAINRFYLCETCGNLIGKIKDSGVSVVCCGKPMKELIPNTTDASQEKHVPVVKVEGSKVTVTIGSVEHPMTPEHFIEWIYVQTEKGGQRKSLQPGEKPAAVFEIVDDKPVAAFAYCNLHGLWLKEL